ncbi:MAG TPA: hypothetical protein VEW07_09990 [Solirubrobacterales bacterium]|nr:hypothetical protein [Solirubrobacterales bacterium]
MIKKTMLLAASACALVAFAVPATVQASPDWVASQAITEGAGSITTVTAVGLSTGPVSVTFSGQSSTTTEGVIADFVTDVPGGGVPTNVPNCRVVAITNSTTSGGEGRAEEWPIALHTSGAATHMTISNITYTSHYEGAGCAGAGVPAKTSATGSATLIVPGGAGNGATANGVLDPLTLESGGIHVIPAVPINLTSTGNLTWKGPAVTP